MDSVARRRDRLVARAHHVIVEPDAHWGQQGRPRPDLDLLVVPRRLPVLAMRLDHRQRDAVVFHIAIAPSRFAEPLGAADFEPHQVVCVVDDPHAVSVGVTYAQSCVPDDVRLIHARETEASAAARRARVAVSGSDVPKIALPATRIEAPADTTSATLEASMPPSISIGAADPARLRISRTRRSLSRLWGMNAWPPNPGFTDMTSTKSTSPAMSSSEDAGVAGLMTAPALAPSLLMAWIVRCRCAAASTWTETMLAPASTKSSM